MQKAARKHVERVFGVLQVWFAIVRYPALTWSKEHMWEVMPHNMIIECESQFSVFHTEPYERMGPLADVDNNVPSAFVAFLARHQEVQDLSPTVR
jgi:hypothetical protein